MTVPRGRSRLSLHDGVFRNAAAREARLPTAQVHVHERGQRLSISDNLMLVRKASPDEEETNHRHQSEQGSAHRSKPHDSPEHNFGRSNWLGDHGINRFVLDVLRQAERTDQHAHQQHQHLGAPQHKVHVNSIGVLAGRIQKPTAKQQDRRENPKRHQQDSPAQRFFGR